MKNIFTVFYTFLPFLLIFCLTFIENVKGLTLVRLDLLLSVSDTETAYSDNNNANAADDGNLSQPSSASSFFTSRGFIITASPEQSLSAVSRPTSLTAEEVDEEKEKLSTTPISTASKDDLERRGFRIFIVAMYNNKRIEKGEDLYLNDANDDSEADSYRLEDSSTRVATHDDEATTGDVDYATLQSATVDDTLAEATTFGDLGEQWAAPEKERNLHKFRRRFMNLLDVHKTCVQFIFGVYVVIFAAAASFYLTRHFYRQRSEELENK